MRMTLLCGTLCTAMACGGGVPNQEAVKAEVVTALDTLVAELVADRPANPAGYTERLRAYLEAHPGFYGSAAALLDEAGAVTASPYVYRTADGYSTLDLAQPDYNIEEQDWITMPLAAGAGIWTPPYFDEGGGEIWMITRSVPVRDGGRIFAIVTTDLPVEEAAVPTAAAGGRDAIAMTAFATLGFLIVVLGYPLLIVGVIFLLMNALDSARRTRRPRNGKSLWPWRYSIAKPRSCRR